MGGTAGAVVAVAADAAGAWLEDEPTAMYVIAAPAARAHAAATRRRGDISLLHFLRGSGNEGRGDPRPPYDGSSRTCHLRDSDVIDASSMRHAARPAARRRCATL